MIRAAFITIVLAGLAACSDPAGGPLGEQAGAPGRERLSPSVLRDLAALRAATARFHRIDAAHDAGWATQFPPGCFDSGDPAVGAMGFHFINGALVGSLSVTEPQLVIYEPQKDGSLKLVGVEYIVPGEPTDTPPRLFERDFAYNAVFQVWVLHAWPWRENPTGMFRDYNPAVSCRYADAFAGAHH